MHICVSVMSLHVLEGEGGGVGGGEVCAIANF